MSSQPVLNFKNLFKEENDEEVNTKKNSLQPGWISIVYDREKRKIITDKPIESVVERIRREEQFELSNEYLSKWLEEQEKLREELIEDIGLNEYERLYKVYPDEDDEEEEEIYEEEIEELLEDYEDDDYDDDYHD